MAQEWQLTWQSLCASLHGESWHVSWQGPIWSIFPDNPFQDLLVPSISFQQPHFAVMSPPPSKTPSPHPLQRCLQKIPIPRHPTPFPCHVSFNPPLFFVTHRTHGLTQVEYHHPSQTTQSTPPWLHSASILVMPPPRQAQSYTALSDLPHLRPTASRTHRSSPTKLLPPAP